MKSFASDMCLERKHGEEENIIHVNKEKSGS